VSFRGHSDYATANVGRTDAAPTARPKKEHCFTSPLGDGKSSNSEGRFRTDAWLAISVLSAPDPCRWTVLAIPEGDEGSRLSAQRPLRREVAG
jgi:hypothetical protein